MYNPIIFRQYDIRGMIDRELDCEFSYLLGKALVIYMKTKNLGEKITVGHDARLSSPKLYEALIKGLVEHGASVVRLGLITTPISYFSAYKIKDTAMSIMVTGSHNPPEYNGFKLTLDKSTLSGEEIKVLQHIIETKNIAKLNGSCSDFDILDSYVNHYSKEFKHLVNIPVVMDCGNGTAGIVLRKLMKKIGLNFDILFETPNGNFPNHHPNPAVEDNLKSLSKKVLDSKSIVGIGFDGDADRIGVVDENGEFIFGDELLFVFAKDILKRNKNAKIVADVKCSDKLFKEIENIGGTAIMWKTGHSWIKEKIKTDNAALGGELSGHICFRDKNYGYDDAIYASLRLLEILIKEKVSMSKLLSEWPKSYSTPEIRIDTTENKKHKIIKKAKTHFKSDTEHYKVNHIDGVRISYPDGWALIRGSNTQPVVVLRFESKTKSGLLRIKKEVEEFLDIK